MNTQAATEFFRQLGVFSGRWLAAHGLPAGGSDHGDDEYSSGHPRGAVVHYTADARIKTCADEFCKPGPGNAAHVLVCPTREVQPNDAMFEGLAMVRILPTTVVQVRQPGLTANHATVANHWAYGIENVHVGEVRKRDGHWVWWPNDWTATYTGPEPLPLMGRFWQPWALAQIQTNIVLLDALKALWLGRIETARIVGHENVQSVHTKRADGHPMGTDKRDLGALYPMPQVRTVLDAMHDKPEFGGYEATLGAIASDRALLAWMAGMQAYSATANYVATTFMTPDIWPGINCKSWVDYRFVLLQASQSSPKREVLLPGLYALGYDVRDVTTSMELFRVMMGLAPNATLSLYSKAILDRLQDRFGDELWKSQTVA